MIHGYLSKRHVQVIGNVIEVVFGVDDGMTAALLVNHCADGWHFREQAQYCAVHRIFGPVRIQAFGIEQTQCTDHAAQLSHRMTSRRKRLKHSLQAFVHQGVLTNGTVKLIELLSGRKFTVKQQVRHFQEACLGSEVFNGVAPMPQYSFFTIQKSDSACGSPGVFISDIQGNVPCFGAQVRNVNGFFPFRTCKYRKFIFVTFQNDFGIVGHKYMFSVCLSCAKLIRE